MPLDLVAVSPAASNSCAQLSDAMTEASSANTKVGVSDVSLDVETSTPRATAANPHDSIQQCASRREDDGVESIDDHAAFDAGFGLQEHGQQERRPPDVCIEGSFLAAHNDMVMDPNSLAPVDFDCKNETNEVLSCKMCA